MSPEKKRVGEDSSIVERYTHNSWIVVIAKQYGFGAIVSIAFMVAGWKALERFGGEFFKFLDSIVSTQKEIVERQINGQREMNMLANDISRALLRMEAKVDQIRSNEMSEHVRRETEHNKIYDALRRIEGSPSKKALP